ncbi:MAG: hypothetical protein HYZ00_03280, partial [Candidatus Hydrogenedentes bacterium]|nr:hypothetical protein [Candidatus Hydrogenedentota bacterium]
MRFRKLLLFLACLCVLGAARAQVTQGGVDLALGPEQKLAIEYMHYRPAQWERERVHEFESEFPNQGGLVHLYFTNVSDGPVHLRFWRVNDQDESYWVLNHLVAWARNYKDTLAPGEMGVLELNALDGAFGERKTFAFDWVDASWKPVLHYETALVKDPIQITLLRVLPGMETVEIHVRNVGDTPVRCESVEIVGHATETVQWRGEELPGGGHAIARLQLQGPLTPAALMICRLKIRDGEQDRAILAHRRAFADSFPIGTWSVGPDDYALLRRHHIDTMVKGGSKSDAFFGGNAARYGYQAIVSTGLPVNVDMVRDLSGHPAVSCWMLQDEPDWATPSEVMLFAEETVRQADQTRPTFITLCRNSKFFEYAPIADIPCMDHYAVTAPSSSKWPQPYGTYLEETGHYTSDLKRASEPKPIWIWSQAIATWEERPRRPVPTPEELAVQLLLNLGRGAKGILWFNYEQNVAERYPDVLASMQGWGRVMRLLRNEFLSAEPVQLSVSAPDKVDVAP